MKTYMLLFGLIALTVKSSSSMSQPINLYGIVEGIEYNPVTLEAIANLYIAYDNNYDFLPSSFVIGCYISKDTVKDAQDKKFLEVTLSSSSFFDSYHRRDVTADMSGETGNWYILMVIDEKNNIAETNEKDNILHSSMFTVGGGTGLYKASIVSSSEQIYPNPIHDKTTISFSLTQNSQVSIIIYDALGKEVATVVNRNLQAGTYKYDFEKKNLPSGIYHCTLTSGSRTISKKMMIY